MSFVNFGSGFWRVVDVLSGQVNTQGVNFFTRSSRDNIVTERLLEKIKFWNLTWACPFWFPQHPSTTFGTSFHDQHQQWSSKAARRHRDNNQSSGAFSKWNPNCTDRFAILHLECKYAHSHLFRGQKIEPKKPFWWILTWFLDGCWHQLYKQCCCLAKWRTLNKLQRLLVDRQLNI